MLTWLRRRPIAVLLGGALLLLLGPGCHLIFPFSAGADRQLHQVHGRGVAVRD